MHFKILIQPIDDVIILRIRYKYRPLGFYHLLSPSLGFEQANPKPTLVNWVLHLRCKGYQKPHDEVGSHCLAHWWNSKPEPLKLTKPISPCEK